MKMLRLVARLGCASKGNVGVIFALAWPLVIGSAAFGMETCLWCYEQHQLQVAADAAANAASLENHNGADSPAVDQAALNVAVQNGFNPSIGAIKVQKPAASGATADNSAAVNVVLTQQTHRFFTQVFSEPVVIKASATAVFQTATNACILALDPTAPQAAYFSRRSSLILKGCVVMSDSEASDAVYVWRASSLTAPCIVSGGGVRQTGGVTVTDCPAPITNAQPAADPYVSIPQPSTDGPCLTARGGALQPGIYCASVRLKGDVALLPGTYVFEGGLTIDGDASVTGDGVTLFMSGPSGVSINRDATLHLSAPVSGTYSGILFFGDRSVTGVTNTFDGKASSVLTGALYFPTQNVSYIGDFSGQGGCTQIVADTVSWSGEASLRADCSRYGMSPMPVLSAVKLVERG